MVFLVVDHAHLVVCMCVVVAVAAVWCVRARLVGHSVWQLSAMAAAVVPAATGGWLMHIAVLCARTGTALACVGVCVCS